jgi:alkylation response protein AidB-like acyl-CoA dehydrogenase
MVTTMRRFELTQEQDELQRAARGFIERRLPVAHLRALRDAKDPTHVSRAIWREMAALGWAGIAVDEAHGGAGLGLVELGLVMEELGRTDAAPGDVGHRRRGAGRRRGSGACAPAGAGAR